MLWQLLASHSWVDTEYTYIYPLRDPVGRRAWLDSEWHISKNIHGAAGIYFRGSRFLLPMSRGSVPKWSTIQSETTHPNNRVSYFQNSIKGINLNFLSWIFRIYYSVRSTDSALPHVDRTLYHGEKTIHAAELGLDKVEWLYNSPHNEFSCITLFYSILFHSIFNQEHQTSCHGLLFWNSASLQ